MRWRGHVTYTRDMRNKNKILSFYPDNLNDRDTLGILMGQYIKLDLEKEGEMVMTGLLYPKIWSSGWLL
jgi:hypothetical protein